MIPPLLLWLDIRPPDQRRVRLWLPLFLVWLLLLPLLVLVLVVTAVVDLALLLFGRRYHHYTLLYLGCWQALAATRGLVVRVNGDNAIVDVAIQ